MSAHGMSEADGLRECVTIPRRLLRGLLDETDYEKSNALHAEAQAILAAHPDPEADPTAGERQWERVRRGPFRPTVRPATPDAGDASTYRVSVDTETGAVSVGDASTSASEPLSDWHVVTLHERMMGLVWSCTCNATGSGAREATRRGAEEHQRTHLAAREAKARAEAGEQIAQAILDGCDDLAVQPCRRCRHAARIAREVTRP